MKDTNNLNYQILQMREVDLSSVYELVQTTIQVSYHEIYPPEAIEYFKEYHQKDVILMDAMTGYTVLAKCGGAIVASGTLLDSNIRRVFVHPSYQHKGIGKLIWGELLRKAELNLLTVLELDASLVSRRFWESMGFHILGEKFIPVWNDKKLIYYQMVKTLPSSR